jgi:hypothetical protein
MLLGSRPAIVAIAVRQIAPGSNGGSADTSEKLASNIVTASSLKAKDVPPEMVTTRGSRQLRIGISSEESAA